LKKLITFINIIKNTYLLNDVENGIQIFYLPNF